MGLVSAEANGRHQADIAELRNQGVFGLFCLGTELLVVASRTARLVALSLSIVVLQTPAFAGAASKRAIEIQKIQTYRQATWHWQRVIGIPRTPTSYGERRTTSSSYRKWILELWQRRDHRLRVKAAHVPHKRAWLCIHRGEGAWSARTGNGYYGGLQMDITFQREYGRYLLNLRGTADHWSPREQMWVAEHAYESGRGFHPWPNTARACGLI